MWYVLQHPVVSYFLLINKNTHSILIPIQCTRQLFMPRVIHASALFINKNTQWDGRDREELANGPHSVQETLFVEPLILTPFSTVQGYSHSERETFGRHLCSESH